VPDDPAAEGVAPGPFWEKFVSGSADQSTDQSENKVALLSNN